MLHDVFSFCLKTFSVTVVTWGMADGKTVPHSTVSWLFVAACDSGRPGTVHSVMHSSIADIDSLMKHRL